MVRRRAGDVLGLLFGVVVFLVLLQAYEAAGRSLVQNAPVVQAGAPPAVTVASGPHAVGQGEACPMTCMIAQSKSWLQPGETVQLKAFAGGMNYALPSSFRWDFGDGSTGTGAEVSRSYWCSPQYAYCEYTGNVTITNGERSCKASFMVQAAGLGNTPAISVNPISGIVPLTVHFDGSRIPPNPDKDQCNCPYGLTSHGWRISGPDFFKEYPGTEKVTEVLKKPGLYRWQFWPCIYYSGGLCASTLVYQGSVVVLPLPDCMGSQAAKGGPRHNPNTVFHTAGRPRCGPAMGSPSYTVNTTSLNLVVADRDFFYQGRGPAVEAARIYNSDASTGFTTPSMFGYGWSFSYDSFLKKESDRAVVKKGSGQETTFQGLFSGTSPVEGVQPEGVADRLTWYPGDPADYFLFREKESRLIYRYDFSASLGLYRLTSVTDQNGNALTVQWGAGDTIESLTDAAGRITTFAYDGSNRCTSMTTPEGKSALYEYDGQGNLVRTVDLAGYISIFTYDGAGYMTSMAFEGNTTGFAYGMSGGWYHVEAVTDARGNVTEYEVLAVSPRTVKVQDPQGNITTFASAGANTTTVTDGAGNTTATGYTGGYPALWTDANGNSTVGTYDGRGNLLSVTDATGGVTTFIYDGGDNLLTKTNALGAAWAFTYDGKGNLTKVVSPSGAITAYSYDANGLLLSTQDGLGRTYSYTYDAFGNRTSITDPLGNATHMSYGGQGLRLSSSADPRGNVTSYEYDGNFRLTKTIYPDGTFVRRTYGCCALTSLEDENGNVTTYALDGLGHLTATTDALGNTTQQAYDGNSNRVAITNALSQKTSVEYNGVDRPVKVADPLGRSTSFAYDKEGNLTGITDPLGNTTALTYDATNLPTGVTDARGNAVVSSRDGMGRIALKTNGRGQAVGYSLDNEGRVTRKAFPGSTFDFHYDAVGNLTGFTDGANTTAYEYDPLDRVARILYANGLSVSFAYDSGGNVAAITYPGGVTASYTYDKRSRAASVAWGTQGVTFTYDGVGNVLVESRSNGTATTHTYDANNRVTGITHSKGGAPFAEMQYTRNVLGHITSESAGLPLDMPVFIDDTETGLYGPANELLSWSSASHIFDKDGNLLSVGDGWTFSGSYDAENRVTAMTVKGRSRTYGHDALGRRVRSLEGGTAANYHYDHLDRLLCESDGSGNITAWYFYNGPRLVAMKRSGTAFYHFDKTGSTVALTDEVGNLLNLYLYEPSGALMASSGTTPNPFTYSGAFGVTDEGDGIYMMRNRFYDARTGRFLQRDPIGIFGGYNLYAYVQNNPVHLIDPSGLEGLSEAMYDARHPGHREQLERKWREEEFSKKKQVAFGRAVQEMAKDMMLYPLDKLMNFIDRFQLGNLYSGTKVGYYCVRGSYVKAAWEGTKMGISVYVGAQTMNPWAGALTGTALDFLGDAVEHVITAPPSAQAARTTGITGIYETEVRQGREYYK